MPESNENYPPEVLAEICPVCHAIGYCLKKKMWGQEYMTAPHPERVASAKEKSKR